MSIKIQNKEKDKIVLAREMPQFTFAQIVNWSHREYIDIIVFRIGSQLYSADFKQSKNSHYWANVHWLCDDCQVKILPKGTKLEIVIE